MTFKKWGLSPGSCFYPSGELPRSSPVFTERAAFAASSGRRGHAAQPTCSQQVLQPTPQPPGAVWIGSVGKCPERDRKVVANLVHNFYSHSASSRPRR